MTPEELLDRAAAAREVAMLVALVLIRVAGDPAAALAMLVDFDGIATPEGDQLDAVTIAAQAIRDALGMGVTAEMSVVSTGEFSPAVIAARTLRMAGTRCASGHLFRLRSCRDCAHLIELSRTRRLT